MISWLVKVGKFVFPADFLILDCEEDHKAPIILGQPFLAMGRIIIDCEKGGFTMRVGDQTMTINVYNTIRYMDNDEECHSLQDSTATATAEDTDLCYISSTQIKDFMHLQEEDRKEVDDRPFQEQQIKPFTPRFGMKFKSLDFTEFVPPKPSIEIAPSLELKPLPSHLKYVYLGANDTLPVIISSHLNANQELSVVNLLKQYKKAIGMPFGLCNAPTTFQRCMLAIFSDMVEDYLEVFMNDFSVSGDNFDSCLGNLAKVLKRCEESDLVLN
ncbi:hypothetical protein V6N13_020761 [Hibiscus sabdariffa]